MAEETAPRAKPHQLLLTLCLLGIASIGSGAVAQPTSARTVLVRAAQTVREFSSELTWTTARSPAASRIARRIFVFCRFLPITF